MVRKLVSTSASSRPASTVAGAIGPPSVSAAKALHAPNRSPADKALRTPKYRRHRPSGQAVVTIAGRDHYLGPHGSAGSRLEYDRLIAEWLANGRQRSIAAGLDLSVNELLVAYFRWCESYYQNGSKEPENIRFAVRPLVKLYGHTPAAEFGPLALKTVREAMIRDDLCRNEINKRVGRVVRVFKWGVENELIPPAVLHGLKAVPGLRRGRSDARESDPVKPVAAGASSASLWFAPRPRNTDHGTISVGERPPQARTVVGKQPPRQAGHDKDQVDRFSRPGPRGNVAARSGHVEAVDGTRALAIYGIAELSRDIGHQGQYCDTQRPQHRQVRDVDRQES